MAPEARSRGAAPAAHRDQPANPLEECMRNKDVKAAWDMFEDMLRRGAPTTRFTVSRLMMLTIQENRAPRGSATVRQAIALADQFIQLHPQEADEVLFNALLDMCYHAKDLPRLEATVVRMEELQVRPSHVTLGVLVKAYGQAGDAMRVMNIWDRMAEERSQANAVTCGCMMDACVNCGRMDKAMEIFQDMKRKKKHRNTIFYTTLIKGYGLAKDLRGALTLFREMKNERVPYNRITYNSVIDVCIKCSDVLAAENILSEMIAPGSGLEPDLITYSTLLKGYCHAGDLDKALRVADTITACGLSCDELVYNSLLDGCVRANDLSVGIGLFAEMLRSGVQPSAITHGILVRLYQRSANPDGVDASEAVAQLFWHHGLPRPAASLEPRGRHGGAGRRRKRQQRYTARGQSPQPLGLSAPSQQQPSSAPFAQQQAPQQAPTRGGGPQPGPVPAPRPPGLSLCLDALLAPCHSPGGLVQTPELQRAIAPEAQLCSGVPHLLQGTGPGESMQTHMISMPHLLQQAASCPAPNFMPFLIESVPRVVEEANNLSEMDSACQLLQQAARVSLSPASQPIQHLDQQPDAKGLAHPHSSSFAESQRKACMYSGVAARGGM